MPNDNKATSVVATNAGTTEEVPNLSIPVNRIYNFVEAKRKDYFEDHSLDWCLDEIITRGIAEITRQVKTAQVRAEQQAAGKLLKDYNMSPKEAAEFLKQAIALQKQASNASNTTK